MNKLLTILAVLLLASSCITQKRCLEKFPSTNDTIRIITVHDSIVYKDTTVYINLPGEVVVDSVEIPCPDPGPNYVPDTAWAETDFAIAKAWFDYPDIQLEIVQADTTLQFRLENALREAYYWKTEYEKVTITPQPIKYIPTIYKIAFWMWIGIIVALLGYFGFKIGKKFI